MNECRISFRGPADVITKAFSGRASGWIKENDFADLSPLGLSFSPFPRGESFSRGARRQQHHARALPGRLLLKGTELETPPGSFGDLFGARVQDRVSNVFTTNCRSVHHATDPFANGMAFAHQAGGCRIGGDHSRLDREQQGEAFFVRSNLPAKIPGRFYTGFPCFRPGGLIRPGTVWHFGNLRKGSGLSNAFERRVDFGML